MTQSEKKPSDPPVNKKRGFSNATEPEKVEYSITMKDEACILKVKAIMAAKYPQYPLDKTNLGPGGHFKLTRFCRSQKHKPERTVAALIEYMQFRREWHLNDLRISHVFEAMNCVSIQRLGQTKFGNEAIFFSYDDRNLPGDLELMAACIYVIEAIDCDIAESLAPVAMVGAMDCFNIRRYNVKLDKMAMQLIYNYYPERLGPVIVTNCGPMFRIAWAMCKPWIPDSFSKQVMALGKHPEKGISTIFDPENVIPRLGGTMEQKDYLRSLYEKEGIPYGTIEALPVDKRVWLSYYGSDETAKEYQAVWKGFMGKRTRIGRWTRYYGVLTDDTLFYFKGPNKKMPNNGIPLSFCTVCAGAPKKVKRSHTITLETSDRPYYFSFDTEAARDDCLAKLGQVIGDIAGEDPLFADVQLHEGSESGSGGVSDVDEDLGDVRDMVEEE